MRSLVTGGTGFVGANLVRRLVADGHDVHLLLRRAYRAWRIAGIEGMVHLHVVDMSQRGEVARLVETVRPEWVFSLAAHGAYSYQTDLQEMMATNFVGALNLVEVALGAGAEAVVQAGSSSEYGFKDHAPSEDEAISPNSEYAVTKAAATLYFQFLAEHRSAPVTVLRLYSVYGPWEEPTRLLPTLVVRALDGRLPPLVAPGTARDYVYVDDAVEAFLAAARSGRSRQTVYNIGTGTQVSLREVVDVVCQQLAVKEVPNWGAMAGRSWDTDRWVANPSSARADLGWLPKVSLDAGVKRLVEWLRGDKDLLAWYRATIGESSHP